MSFNKIIIIGNLGRDPDLRYTPQGTPVCTFPVATSEKKKRGDDTEEITTWFRVTAWGRQAENSSQYLTKGKPVYIEGRLRLSEYEDREGKKRHSLEVTASEIHYLPTGNSDSYDARTARDADRQDFKEEGPDLSDDDIPF